MLVHWHVGVLSGGGGVSVYCVHGKSGKCWKGRLLNSLCVM